MQHRAIDALGGLLVRAVVFDIDGCRGSIFLADSMNAGRIAIGGDLFLENFRAEGTLPEGVMEHCLGSTEQIALWKGLALRQ